MSVADGDIEVAQTSHDTVTDAYPAPTATSNAAAGWDDPLPASVYGSAV
jgi:hypothetical protein